MTKEQVFRDLPKLKKEDSILFLTHNDLDGAGAVLLKNIFPKVDVIHCTNGGMNYQIKNTLTDPEILQKYDKIIACDISCTPDTADIIDRALAYYGDSDKFVLLDHHPTAQDIADRDWAVIYGELIEDSKRAKHYEGYKGGMSSGTALLYDYLDYNGLISGHPHEDIIDEYVFNVSKYDTWDWKNVFNEKGMPELNKVFGIYGIDVFEREMVEKIRSGSPLIDRMENVLMEIEDKKIESYLFLQRKGYETGTITIDDNTYSYMLSRSSNYLSYVFDDMKSIDGNIDLYIVNHGHGISIRSEKENIDVGMILKRFGGGGHRGAAGIRFDKDAMNAIMSITLGGALIEPNRRGFSYSFPKRE